MKHRLGFLAFPGEEEIFSKQKLGSVS